MGRDSQPRDVVMLGMLAGDPYSAGTDFGFVLTFREPVQAERLYDSYCRLVDVKPALRTTLCYDPTSRRYTWQPMEEGAWRRYLAAEEARFHEPHDLQEVVSEWSRPAEHMPFRLARIDAVRYVATFQHTWNDGLGALRWLNPLLALYMGSPIDAEMLADAAPVSERRLPRRMVVARTLWALWFLLRRVPGAGRRAGQIVDLTHGIIPDAPNTRGFTLLDHTFAPEETRAMDERARRHGLTRTQLFCGLLAESLFELQPEKSAARLSLAVNLRPELGLEPTGLGAANYWAPLIFELHTAEAWPRQIVREYRWIKRGLPGAMRSLLQRQAERAGDAEMVRQLSGVLELPHAHPRRGYLRQYTCVVSHLGEVRDREIGATLRGLTLYSKYELLSVSLALFDGSLSLALTVPNNLYIAAEVARLRDLLVARLAPTACHC